MNAIVENKTFEDKLKDRIRDSIGDLLSEDDLKKLVERGMEDVFFKGKEERDSWGRVTKEHPPLIHQMVKDHLEPIVREEVKLYIDENREVVEEVISKTLEAGVGTLMIKCMNDMFSNQLYNMQAQMMNELRNNGVIR